MVVDEENGEGMCVKVVGGEGGGCGGGIMGSGWNRRSEWKVM